MTRPIGRVLTVLLMLMLCQGGVRFEVHAHTDGESAASQHDVHAHEHDFDQPHRDGLHHHVHELGTVSAVLILDRSVQLSALRSAVLRVADLAMPSSKSSAPPIRPPIVG